MNIKPLIFGLVFTASFCYSARGIACQTDNDSTKYNQFFDAGMLKYKRSDFSGALKDFETVVSLNQKYGKAYQLKAACERELRLFENAVHDYSKAIDINKNDWESYLGRGISLHQLNKFEKALS
ncbi:MAG TPA: hypothetical protein VL728_03970 [Cyclobacteriaceae bacterium]|jgi:Flp pilus assembly protein TadD|nr:hypothetical protein [Cyclobacteriaceae bacterium]